MTIQNKVFNVWDYLSDLDSEKQGIMEAIESVIDSGKLIFGPKLSCFENEFANYIGSKYSLGVGNATDGLFLALKAININPGDEIITVSNTAVPTVSAIMAAGGIPVFIDIDKDTFLMNTNLLEDAITKKTRAILPVHLYGQSADIDHIKEIIKHKNIYIIEDCAQSTGSLYKSKRTGNLGDIGVFSFYPTKVLGAFGDGGSCTTNDLEIFNHLKRLRFYGMESTYFSIEQGYNSRLDDIQAAILSFKLSKLDEYIASRNKIANKYDEHLKATNFFLPKRVSYGSHSFYLYVVKHHKRDALMDELRKRNINLSISYPWPIHTMPICKEIKLQCSLQNTERVANEIFSLPMYPGLSEHDQELIISHLLEVDKLI